MSIGILDLVYGNTFKPGLTPASLPINRKSFLSGISVSGNNFSFDATGNYKVEIFIESDFSGSDGSFIAVDVYNITRSQSVGDFNIDANSGESSWMIPLTVISTSDQYTVRAVTFSQQPGTIRAARIVATNLDGVGQDSILRIKGLDMKEGGSDARMGAIPLVAGTAVVNSTAVTANSRIFLQAQSGVGSHALHVSARVPGVSFTITSSNGADTSLIAWMIVEPF